MVLTPSTMLPLGTEAPPFRLPDPDGTIVSREDFRDARGLLVMFLCNHCPYVQYLREALATFCHEYLERGVATVAINSNDFLKYPADSPAKMKEEIATFGYTFPYLVDEDQEVAKAYHAACTPDFFLFDSRLRLIYRGQFDGARPGNDTPITGADLRAAANALLEGDTIASTQRPSAGCNIKWRPGNEPSYAGV